MPNLLPVIRLVSLSDQRALAMRLWDDDWRFKSGDEPTFDAAWNQQAIVIAGVDSLDHFVLYDRPSVGLCMSQTSVGWWKGLSEFTLVNSPNHFISLARRLRTPIPS